MLSIPTTWRRKPNEEEGFLMTSTPSSVMAARSFVSPAPWMPPRTSECSQKCSAECHSPAPLPPMSEPPNLTLLFFHSLFPITSYLSSLCFIVLSFSCTWHSITYRTYTALCPLVFTVLQMPLYFSYYYKHLFLSISACLQQEKKKMTVHSGKT